MNSRVLVGGVHSPVGARLFIAEVPDVLTAAFFISSCLDTFSELPDSNNPHN